MGWEGGDQLLEADWIQKVKGKVSTLFLINQKLDLQKNREPEDPQQAEQEETLRLIWRAHQDWQQARRILNEAADADLIDCAIQNLAAAESRYQYLLKKARLNQVVAYDPEELREVDADDVVS